MTITRVGRISTTENRNDKQDIPNHQLQAEKLEGKRQRSCEEIGEEHTRETRNHIETEKRRICHKAPIQVYKVLPPPPQCSKGKKTTVLYHPSPSVHRQLRPILTSQQWPTTNNQHDVNIDHRQHSSIQRLHRFRIVSDHFHRCFESQLRHHSHHHLSHYHHSHHHGSPHHGSHHLRSHHHSLYYAYTLLGHLYYR